MTDMRAASAWRGLQEQPVVPEPLSLTDLLLAAAPLLLPLAASLALSLRLHVGLLVAALRSVDWSGCAFHTAHPCWSEPVWMTPGLSLCIIEQATVLV